jgi:hypothetical protein
VVEKINAPSGVAAALAALTTGAPFLAAPQVNQSNVAAETTERSSGGQYPALHVYCEKIVNDQKEKFRSFSGRVAMAIDVRCSQDRIDGLQDQLELYADSVMQTLEAARGDWGDGMFFGGAYQVTFAAIKHGGRNFVQTAKVAFEIDVSRN